MSVRYGIVFLLASLLFLQSCSTTKLVPEGDALYTGAEIDLFGDIKKKQKKKIVSDLEKMLKPKPNKTTFGLKWRLALYTALYNGKEKGIKASLRRRFGEAPVLYSSVNPIFTKEVLNSEMFNRGFFHSITSYTEVEEGKKKMQVRYLIQSGPGYRVKEYNMTLEDTAMNKVVQKVASETEVKQKRRYHLNRLKDERVRIDAELKNNGYYYFSPDYLKFQIDSNEKTKELHLRLKVKEDVPKKAMQKYWIRHVMVMMDSSYSFDSLDFKRDTIFFEQVHLSLSKHFLPKAVSRYVFLKEGALYSREDHQLTLNRLMGMGLFQYVNLSITEVDSVGLNVNIHLAPLPKKSISVEVQAVSKSNNFIGPRLNLVYTDRNLLKGGEKFTSSFHGSMETQLSGEYKGLFTFEVGPSFELSFPRFILPVQVKAVKLYTPTTNFGADFDFSRRVNYFDMRSLRLTYSYRWKTSQSTEHEFIPAYVTFFSIRNISTSFQEELKANPSLQRRYEDQLIPGTMYTYTYSEQAQSNKRNQVYFQGLGDISGNLMALIAQSSIGNTREDGVRTIGSMAYAQFARFAFDMRDYINLNIRSKTQLVGRMYLGLGFPYANSKALPYVKSFFSGGPYSVRAFTVNSLGPGTYRSPDFEQNLYYAQIGGDIKLEWNLELRFPIVSVLKGALFTDMGNTWLLRANPDLPGGQFAVRNVFKESGVGVGLGFRVDITFFVIRLDLATPLRKPWLPESERWIGHQVNFSDPQWRRENLLLNIAIGYPF